MVAEKKWLQNLQNNLQFLERDLFAISGFAHPKLPVLTHPNNEVEFMAWGFIPSWTRTFEDGKKFWNNTLNARGETIFEKSGLILENILCNHLFFQFYQYISNTDHKADPPADHKADHRADPRAES